MNINSFPSEATDIENIEEKSFVLDLKGFEGPLHLLLNLSRSQKVDLRKISLVDLSDQYLNFIAEVIFTELELSVFNLISKITFLISLNLSSKFLLRSTVKESDINPVE